MTTQPTITRSRINSLLEEARHELSASFEGLSGDQMEAPKADGWSVKDVLAHVAMWNEMELGDMRRVVRGHQPTLERFDYSFIDDWNDIQLRLRKGFPLRQVLDELSESRDGMMEFLLSAPDEMLATGYIPMACMHSIRHDQRHAADIRNWRQEERI
jgi:hypothetical protein